MFLHVFSLGLGAVGLPVEGAGGWSLEEAGPAFSCWSQPADVVGPKSRRSERVTVRVQLLCGTKMAQPKFAFLSNGFLHLPVLLWRFRGVLWL